MLYLSHQISEQGEQNGEQFRESSVSQGQVEQQPVLQGSVVVQQWQHWQHTPHHSLHTHKRHTMTTFSNINTYYVNRYLRWILSHCLEYRVKLVQYLSSGQEEALVTQAYTP